MPNPAPCLRKLLADATTRWPDRSRASDGIMADAAHLARKSDHNVGNAADITHDPAHGVDCNAIAEAVKTDPRVTYVIWSARIYKARTGKWETYHGPNAHKHHCHVSIKPESRSDLSPWPWSLPTTDEKPAGLPTLKLTVPMARGEQVTLLQRRLVYHGIDIVPDGVFGFGTSKAVRLFQEKKKLKVDGEVGPNTWKALLAN